MPDRDDNYEKFNHSKAIREQIKHLGHLVTEMDTENQQGWNQYWSKVSMGLAYLDSLIDPFRGADDESPIKDKQVPNTREKKLEYIHESLTQMTNFLYDENLFYVERTGRRKT